MRHFESEYKRVSKIPPRVGVLDMFLGDNKYNLGNALYLQILEKITKGELKTPNAVWNHLYKLSQE